LPPIPYNILGGILGLFISASNNVLGHFLPLTELVELVQFVIDLLLRGARASASS
jgi:hypothetical protein